MSKTEKDMTTSTPFGALKQVDAGLLSVGYAEAGPADGPAVLLLHGWPYDIHSFASATPLLAAAGYRVIVPYLRGYGPTRFLSRDAPRSGEQAALACDLLALLDALAVPKAVIGGYDWGGRACCILSALWPERVVALVSGNSYNIQNIARSLEPASAEREAAMWYQYYFHSERGRRGLAQNRREITRLLWKMWSPHWQFDDATFERSAAAFDNPDFVDIVIHSYRHRFGLVPGDPAMAHIETRLAMQPPISVPAITIDGDADGVNRGTAHHAPKFTGLHRHRVFKGAGHNPPQERPAEWVQAVLDARAMSATA